MSSVYMYVNFRFTKTVSVNVKLFRDDSLETLSFISRPCLFIPLQEKSTVTGIRLIGENINIIYKNMLPSYQLGTQGIKSWMEQLLPHVLCPAMMPFSVRSQRLLF